MKTLLAALLIAAFVVRPVFAQTPELIIPDGHIAPVSRVLLSPDEQFIFTLSADETVRMWDFATGATVRTFRNASHSFAITPNGKFLITGAPYIFSKDSLIRVWRVDNGMLIRTLPGHDVVGVDPESKTMILLGREGGRMVVYRSGILVGEPEFLASIDSATAWTADYDLSRLALGYPDGRIDLINVQTGAIRTLREHAEDIVQLQFTRDGRYLISAAADRLINMYDTRQHKRVRSLWANFSRTFCVDPSATKLWSTSFDNTVDQFDLLTGEYTGLIDHHTYSIASLALTQDGEVLVEACTDKKIRIVHVPTRQLLREIGPSSLFVSHLSIDQTSRFLVSSGFDHRIRIWNIQTGEWVKSISSQDVMKTVVAEKIHALISTVAGPSLDIKSWPNGEFVRMRGYHEFLCYAFALSRSQQWMATGGYDRRIHIYSTPDGPPTVSMSGPKGNIMALVFSDDEQVLFSSSFDEQVTAWSRADGRRLWSTHAGLINELITAPDGRLLGAGQNGYVYEWSDQEGALHRSWKAHGAPVSSIALHRESQRLVTASEDGTVRVWNYATLTEEAVLEGHRGAVNSVVITPDGKRLASAGHEGSIRLWDLESKQLLAILVGLRDNEWITVLKDGRYFGSANADRSLYYRFDNVTYSMRQFADILRVEPANVRLDDCTQSAGQQVWTRPPVVEIVRPYAARQIQNGQLRFEVNAKNNDPLSLRLYLNNELVEDRRLDPTSTIVECVVRLRHGHNQIRVVGVDDRGLKSTESKLYVYYD